MAIFVNSCSLHSGYTIEGNKCDYYAIVFDLNLLSSSPVDTCRAKYLAPLLNCSCKLPLVINGVCECEKEILSHTRKLILLNKNTTAGYEIGIKANLQGILYQFINNEKLERVDRTQKQVKQYNIDQIKKLLSFIHENYNKKISIKDMADIINVSEYHFFKVFKKATGKTPVEYLNYYRTKKVVELIENTDLKILNISMDVGFANFSYFIKTFKRFNNCTPSEYRSALYRSRK